MIWVLDYERSYVKHVGPVGLYPLRDLTTRYIHKALVILICSEGKVSSICPSSIYGIIQYDWTLSISEIAA